MFNLRKATFLGLMIGISLVIYIVESQIPVIFPGIKLGLANVISLSALLILGWKEALTITIIRILLGSIFCGGMSSFLFSIAGGILSNIIMIILYIFFKDIISIYTISIIGAIFHNIGQLFVAAIVVNNYNVYIYLPVLMVSAIITGCFVGIVAKNLKEHIDKICLFE